jgi:hypothetical protein
MNAAGTLLVTGGDEGWLCLWDRDARRHFDPEGDHVITDGAHGWIRLWDTRVIERSSADVKARLGVWLPQ